MSMATQALDEPNPRRWLALALLCLANFMVIMDTSIIGVALPAIQQALGYAQENLQWVFNAYVIFFGGMLLLGGRLSDLFGQRLIFIAGFAILTAASLLAGLAWNEASLNIGRAVQGIGSALIAPSAMTMVMLLFGGRPKELGKALGFWGASAAAGGTAGVFLGGVITEWLSWQWTFLINLPVGALALAVSPVLLAKGSRRPGKVDFAGAIFITGALVIAVYGIVTAEDAGWGSLHTWASLGIAALLLLVFLLIQLNSKDPLVPMRIWAVPNLAAGNLALALLAGGWIPLWFFLNLYLQQVLKLTAFEGGAALLPMTVLLMVFMTAVTGKLIAKFGLKANITVGLAALAGSLFLFSGHTPADGNFLANVLPAGLLGALGMSLAYIPATMASMSGARPEETGLASGLANTSYQIGSAISLAAVSAVAASVTARSADSAVTALNAGFHQAFFWAGWVAVAGAAAAFIFIRGSRASRKL
ncbi:MFS transporter [Cohnella zeiphila]|uniref:MFS transporter n=1 Tax=Cohnella zeiphila TaxID=2761120 RepID=A0A7X0SP92_9BACL|nr:MFS transporter [Cohnella zeiphila]MBB6733677.1 MFS transporter [Cohnella zeiphila]